MGSLGVHDGWATLIVPKGGGGLSGYNKASGGLTSDTRVQALTKTNSGSAYVLGTGIYIDVYVFVDMRKPYAICTSRFVDARKP